MGRVMGQEIFRVRVNKGEVLGETTSVLHRLQESQRVEGELLIVVQVSYNIYFEA